MENLLNKDITKEDIIFALEELLKDKNEEELSELAKDYLNEKYKSKISFIVHGKDITVYRLKNGSAIISDIDGSFTIADKKDNDYSFTRIKKASKEEDKYEIQRY